ncbi:hypothetical protein [Paenirhodobacter sp.]|uniref:hypothetical protein n=1 Tax=Paenirhodobacter sp. TaxID=1965326 RepID=UPI003B420A0C
MPEMGFRPQNIRLLSGDPLFGPVVDLELRAGLIARIRPHGMPPEATVRCDGRGAPVIPGLVNGHTIRR